MFIKFKKFLNENTKKYNVFLGYHSSHRNMIDDIHKNEILDINRYSDVIRNAYLEIISDYDDNLENDDIEAMNNIFNERGFTFTFVSKEPIVASSYQTSKYKYGDYLYKVYGDGSEILLDDINEIGADIVVTQQSLYFEKV